MFLVSEVAVFWFSAGATRLITNKRSITATSFHRYDNWELSAKYCTILQVPIICSPLRILYHSSTFSISDVKKLLNLAQFKCTLCVKQHTLLSLRPDRVQYWWYYMSILDTSSSFYAAHSYQQQ